MRKFLFLITIFFSINCLTQEKIDSEIKEAEDKFCETVNNAKAELVEKYEKAISNYNDKRQHEKAEVLNEKKEKIASYTSNVNTLLGGEDPIVEMLLGDWNVEYTSKIDVGGKKKKYKSSWHFSRDGTVTSSIDGLKGTWEKRKDHIYILFAEKYWSTFNYPLDAKIVTGSSHVKKDNVRAEKLIK